MEATVSTKGQVVIPKRLREQWGLVSGSRLKITNTAAGIQLVPIAARDTKAVRKGLGLAGYKGRRIAIEEMDPVKALEVAA